MKKYSHFSVGLTQQEIKWGAICFVITLFLLPMLLQHGNALLAKPLSASRLNFVYYCINFAAVVWIFRSFLWNSLKAGLRNPFSVIWYGLLGYLGSEALGELLLIATYLVFPSFVNMNNQSIAAMVGQELHLMALATVILVPVAEETLFRGLLFRGLYGKNPAAAWLTSMVAFSAIHVVGYIGTLEPLHLLLSFIQYLPASYCLCWTYRQTGTILSPILMHMIVNAMSIYNLTR